MKYNKLLLLLGVIGMSCNTKSQEQSGDRYTGLNSEIEKEICSKYINALHSFAMVMPTIGGDTESIWAADTIHTMATSLLNKNSDYNRDSHLIHLNRVNRQSFLYFSAQTHRFYIIRSDFTADIYVFRHV